MYSTLPLEELITNKNNKKLVFIHTPKCNGSYVNTILSHLKILEMICKNIYQIYMIL
jgi:hypothetical protein